MHSLRVLILDLYVKWLKDPSISIGFSKSMKDYKVGSRYNGLFIPRKIIEVEELLVDAGYVEELPHFNSPDRTARSYTTRIRHTEALRDLFAELTIDLHDIDTSSALNSGSLQIAISVSVVALLQSKLAALATVTAPTESNRAKTTNLRHLTIVE